MNKKIIFTSILICILMGFSTVTSKAAISANSQTVNSGDNVTISVSSAEKLGSYTISVTDNGGLTFISSSAVSGAVSNGNKISGTSTTGMTGLGSFTFKAPTVTVDTTYKVSITSSGTADPDLNDIPGSTAVATVTVKAPQVNQQPTQSVQPTQPTEPAQQQAELQFTNTNLTMYTTSGLNLRSSPTTQAQNVLGTLKTGTEVKISSKSTTKRDGYYWYKVTADGKTGYIADMNLTSTKPAEEDKDKDKDKDKEDEKKTDEKSTNKALKDLVVENYKLTPDFDPETTKYTIDVTKEVEKLEITPILQDDKAKFEITGNENFKVGNNIVKITVTAEDGTNRIYTITVAKSNKDAEDDAADEGLKLSKLQIKDLNLEPEFKPETTNYSVVVSDPTSIKIADITAIAEDEDVEVTIAEAEADKNGNRVITIMLENEDGTKSGVYQITIKKGMINPIAELQKNKNNRIYYILGGIIGVLVIAIIVVIILLRKTSNRDDFQDIKEADELSDDYDYSLKNAIDDASQDTTAEYDEMVEDSNLKSQILTKPTDYNVFKDDAEDLRVSDETKKYEIDNGDDDDFKPKGKKKGKHF